MITFPSQLKYLLITWFLLWSLMGCSFGPRHQRPEIETPPDYRFSEISQPDTAVNLKWWELYQHPTLDTLILAALEGNKNVQIALSRIEEARAIYGFTKVDLYPKLDIQAGASRGTLFNGVELESETNNFFISPVVNWELDFWGKYRKASEAAKAEFLATQYSLRSLQISLISDVASTYFLLLDYQNRLKIARKTLKLRDESLRIITRRFEEGIIPEIDLFQAKIQREIAVSAIPIFERLIGKTENTLSILLGELPRAYLLKDTLEIEISPPEIPAGLPATLLERRPDIAQAEMVLKAQTARIGVAQALRLPAINLTAALGFVSDDLSKITDGDPSWSISGSLFGPIFNFNKNIRRVDIEKARTEQALFGYENTVLQAFREVEDALLEVRTYREQL
ncbi:MAG: TolC family protein, partial [bacterium]